MGMKVVGPLRGVREKVTAGLLENGNTLVMHTDLDTRYTTELVKEYSNPWRVRKVGGDQAERKFHTETDAINYAASLLEAEAERRAA